MGVTVTAGASGPSIGRTQASTGTVAAASNADITITFAAPFAAPPMVTASVVADHTGDGLQVVRIRTVTTTGCVVHVRNAGLTSRTGTVHVLAVPAS